MCTWRPGTNGEGTREDDARPAGPKMSADRGAGAGSVAGKDDDWSRSDCSLTSEAAPSSWLGRPEVAPDVARCPA